MLEMLPYPSGTLHMGHVLNYTLGDVITHYRRRTGWHVMRPMGFDSFGLPAENAAIREGGHPREIVERNIAHIRTEMRRLGWVIDWDRETSAHEVEYYRWTQWLFLKFFEAGLAYRKAAPVLWCPNDQTVVASEYVIDGRCERCGTPVVARNMDQWFFKITAYADQLLADLELIDWPERTKMIQTNWIGRSEGAEVLFRDEELDLDIPVFTTRPDTLFGATFFVLAPEHPIVGKLGNDEVVAYAEKAAARPVEERQTKEKVGVFTGHYVVNPVNDERIPVWVADYVLMDYGTGAIMAVPAHDERDREFAERYDLPIRPVIDEEAGVLIDSGEFSGLPVDEGLKKIVEWLREKGRGAPAISYRLRDWSFSRQRYWGCPIPIVYCEDDGLVPVPEDQLPVELPEVEDYRPKGKPPLASNEEWINVPCPKCGKPAQARGGHDGHVRRLVLVLPALLRPAQRPGAVGPAARRLLDARRPVRRRHRPRDRAPALLALLRQGAERLRPARLPRAVPAAVPPGLGAPGRDEDVEVEGERDRPRPAGRRCTGRTRCGRTSCSWAPPTRTWSGARRASRASRASCAGCGGS